MVFALDNNNKQTAVVAEILALSGPGAANREALWDDNGIVAANFR